MADKLQQEIKFLPGVGPRRAELFNKELGIYTIKDLLYYFPYKHIDRTRIYSIAELTPEMPYIQVKGKILGKEIIGVHRKKRLVAVLGDGTGTMELVWFNGIRWIQEDIKEGVEYLVFGRPSVFNGKISIIHPEMEGADKKEAVITSALQPFYSVTEKLRNSFLTSKFIHKLEGIILQQYLPLVKETLPEYLIKKLNFLSLQEALWNIHYPVSAEMLRRATMRLKFEELFYIQLTLLSRKSNRERHIKGFVFSKVGDYFHHFYQHNLSFSLTEAQKRVIKEIRRDMGSGRQMNRLLQGDVGSGKTLVALMAMLIALDNGYQACLMAPTEILAQQHYRTFLRFLEGMDVYVHLLTGSSKKSERQEIEEALKSGKLQILIGTHALLEDNVEFSNLGLVIIDEQHRFGVVQRARLRNKNANPPHVLVMTATPIPRTLAMTLYGDLDVSVIDELPPGRKPVQTIHFSESRRSEMYAFLKKQIALGRQIYIVYPLIKESEKSDYKALEQGYAALQKIFPEPHYRLCMVHGKMRPAEKDRAMMAFKEGNIHIMVATTVIEVGVDVPNATVMVIENAERFGLSQLHQLRGRVGRGGEQSFCILMTGNKLTNDARRRIEIMVSSNNGFEIAEVDMKLRGPGDIEGTQQSGMPFNLRIANLAQDGQLLQYAREVAAEVIEKDPELEKPEHSVLKEQLKQQKTQSFEWSLIG